MFISKHSQFILLPIANILQDAKNSLSVLSKGIETYPIIDYIMQSVFLKMTGFQEQKGKCLCWDVATNDFEFRYDDFQKITGEYSRIEDKSKVYSSVLTSIKKYDSSFSLKNDADAILESCRNDIIGIFDNSLLVQNRESEYLFFKNDSFRFEREFLQDDKNLFSKNDGHKTLFNIYELLYRERNRCAHNLRSYQQNLPNFSFLSDEKNKYNNYFYFFWCLSLIDSVYMKLYEEIRWLDFY